ncbi:MAG TPA: hypothetical protein VN457_02475, partial [Chlamydiales bacterium]|nr:hypothetical protein [Chlamydiales bacterium]
MRSKKNLAPVLKMVACTNCRCYEETCQRHVDDLEEVEGDDEESSDDEDEEDETLEDRKEKKDEEKRENESKGNQVGEAKDGAVEEVRRLLKEAMERIVKLEKVVNEQKEVIEKLQKVVTGMEVKAGVANDQRRFSLSQKGQAALARMQMSPQKVAPNLQPKSSSSNRSSSVGTSSSS